MITPETLKSSIENRKLIYVDSTGFIYLYVYEDHVFIDTVLLGPFVQSTYKHWLNVRDELEQALKEKGVYEYYTLVDSYKKFRWCTFLGMETTHLMLTDKIEVMIRNGY